CSTDPETSCTAVTHVHETSTSKAKLLTSFLTVECDVLFLGDTLKLRTESSAAVIEGTFTYTNCGSCEATEENSPAEIKVLKEGHETAAVTGEGLVHVVCGESLNCTYNGVGLKGTAKGPLLSTALNGEVSLSEQTTNKEAGGFLCPAKSKLDIKTTPLTHTYIGKAVHYCVKYEHEHGTYEDDGCTKNKEK